MSAVIVVSPDSAQSMAVAAAVAQITQRYNREEKDSAADFCFACAAGESSSSFSRGNRQAPPPPHPWAVASSLSLSPSRAKGEGADVMEAEGGWAAWLQLLRRRLRFALSALSPHAHPGLGSIKDTASGRRRGGGSASHAAPGGFSSAAREAGVCVDVLWISGDDADATAAAASSPSSRRDESTADNSAAQHGRDTASGSVNFEEQEAMAAALYAALQVWRTHDPCLRVTAIGSAQSLAAEAARALGGTSMSSLSEWRPWCGAPLLFRLADGVAAVAAPCAPSTEGDASGLPRLLQPLRRLPREEVPLHLLSGTVLELAPPPCAASAAAAVFPALQERLLGAFSSSADVLVVSVHAVRFDAEMQEWQLDASNASHPPGLALLWASAAQGGKEASDVPTRLYYTDLEDGVVASEWELLRRLALEGRQAVSADLDPTACDNVRHFVSALPRCDSASDIAPQGSASELLRAWQRRAAAKVTEREERFDDFDARVFDESSRDCVDSVETRSHFRWLGKESEWAFFQELEATTRGSLGLRRTVSFTGALGAALDGESSLLDGDGALGDNSGGGGPPRRRGDLLSSTSLLSVLSEAGTSSAAAADRPASGGAAPLEQRRPLRPRIDVMARLAQVTPAVLQAALRGASGAGATGADTAADDTEGDCHARFEDWQRLSREAMETAGLELADNDAAGAMEGEIFQRLRGAPGLELGDPAERARTEVNADDAAIVNPQRSLLTLQQTGGSIFRRSSTGNLSRSSGSDMGTASRRKLRASLLSAHRAASASKSPGSSHTASSPSSAAGKTWTSWTQEARTFLGDQAKAAVSDTALGRDKQRALYVKIFEACKGNMKRMLRLQVRLDAKEITSMVHDELRVLLPLFQ